MKKRFLKKIILIVKLSLTICYTFCISKLRILLIRFKTFVITLTTTIVNQAKKKLINAWNRVVTYILTKITDLIYQLKIKLTQIITYIYSYIKDTLIKIFYILKLKIIHTFTTSFIINKLAETIKNWHIRFNKFKNKISNTVPFKYKR